MHLKKGILWVASLALIQGCASEQLDTKLDEKLSQESGITSKRELSAEAKHLIEDAPGLSDDQKDKLSELRKTTQHRLNDIGTQSLKLRSILIKDLISSEVNEGELDLIKKRIRGLDGERTTVLFKAIEQANLILGRQAKNSPQLMHDFWLDDFARVR